ncbi:isomerizing glutamine--fructose-6-phosphate transaminase [Chitinibacter tainanensis]|uniref:isomerizing glutamine--fructose-6-phosphate transaminase n=1 Tax=Chitinibacter tainanensis TaxID=230667 RepID=UPI002357B5A6|nr:isomerizing glutamine--fructose-6-phosphate transaminase [Chitinibacter tainanensis]
MPDIIALTAPQNVLPAFTQHCALLGHHEHQLALILAGEAQPALHKLTLSAPVQAIQFPQAHSNWLMASFSTSGAISPYLHQSRLSVAALGHCDEHASWCQRYQLLPSASLSQLVTAMLASELNDGQTLASALHQLAATLSGHYAVIVQDPLQPQYLYALQGGLGLWIGQEDGLRQICTTSAKAMRQSANSAYEMKPQEVVRFGLSQPTFIAADESTTPISMSSGKQIQVPHHMLDEIQSQTHTLAAQVDRYHSGKLFSTALLAKLSALRSITLVASGSSFHAAMIASYWLEQLGGCKVQVELASEYRFREVHPAPDEMLIGISQSGETADTLEAIRLAQRKGAAQSVALTNAPGSTLTSLCDHTLLTESGHELSVSSTKSFTAQLLLLYQFALALGQARKALSSEALQTAEQQMRRLSAAVQTTLEHSKEIRRWASELHRKANLFVIGRHAMYPVALEGAFKFKEVAYQNATGYAAGELKHGPITLIDEELPVIACLPWNEHAERMLSNLHEIRSNHGEIFVLSDGNLASSERFHVIHMPTGLGSLSPITYVIALQLLAYHCALQRGNVIDTPRNLQKARTS